MWKLKHIMNYIFRGNIIIILWGSNVLKDPTTELGDQFAWSWENVPEEGGITFVAAQPLYKILLHAVLQEGNLITIYIAIHFFKGTKTKGIRGKICQFFLHLRLTFVRVPGELWKPHKSKEGNFLEGSYTPNFFPTPPQNIFFRVRKIFFVLKMLVLLRISL